MYKLSNLISMPVMSIYESKMIGIVTNILIDPKSNKCKQIVIISPDDIKYTLDYSNIHIIGKNSIVITNLSKVTLFESSEQINSKHYNPINAEIYDTNGTLIGKVADITLDSKLKIVNIITKDNKTIDIKNVVTYTDSVLIYSLKKVKMSSLKPKTKINKPKNNTKVSIEPIKESVTTHTQTNLKLTDTRTLIGRVTTKDIFSCNHELIIKNNQTINSETITTASKYGKIVELFKFSK